MLRNRSSQWMRLVSKNWRTVSLKKRKKYTLIYHRCSRDSKSCDLLNISKHISLKQPEQGAGQQSNLKVIKTVATKRRQIVLDRKLAKRVASDSTWTNTANVNVRPFQAATETLYFRETLSQSHSPTNTWIKLTAAQQKREFTYSFFLDAGTKSTCCIKHGWR